MEIIASTPPKGPTDPSIQPNHRLRTDIAWKYIREAEDEGGKKLFVCTFCQKELRGGGISRMKQHLAGIKGNVASCMKVPEDVKLLLQGLLDGNVNKIKEKPRRPPRAYNMDGGKAVEVQKIYQQNADANVGTTKAPLKLQSYLKRVVDGDDDALPPGIRVSKFDHSVENHFKLMDKFAVISGESESEFEQTEIQRLSSSVTFLSKWRDFCYQPRSIRFACEKETLEEKDVTTKFNLPQFSSACVPRDISVENDILSPLSKDFVMYVGGPVWAVDWCPRVHQSSTFDTNVEFIAVSAHPPESTYHKIGAPLTGRGLIQIWCVLNTGQSQLQTPLVKVKAKAKARKPITNIDPTKPKKPRGRPRKTPTKESNDSDQLIQDSPVSCPEQLNSMLQLVSTVIDPTKPKKPRGRPRKTPTKEANDSDHLMLDSPVSSPERLNNMLQLASKEDINEKFKYHKLQKPKGKSRKKPVKESLNMQLVIEFTDGSPKTSPEPLAVKFPDNSTELTAIDRFTLLTSELLAKKKVQKRQDFKVYTRRPRNDQSTKSTSNSSPVDQDDALPRLVMGLAHNGKVAWDVKWRPSDSCSVSKHVLGYLAVLLGNGALEVWEVPHPLVTKAIFSSCKKEGNDPRFLKLKPVFLCSMLKCGDRQSIPLTLEWSASTSHDLILAGCHDGVVALWKFSASNSPKDTRPLLCFNADTVPIRALKWAPLASDPETANTIVTAGHKGLKFWDIRDPFHPLWDIPTQKVINSVDWLPDPRCVILSCDDGEIKLISLSKAACDYPVTGMVTGMETGKKQHGTSSYNCSTSSIWSIQASKLTGMVAYCCSDGKVINFQLTTKAVEKDPHRNREPHYYCGSLTEEEDSSLTVLSPLPNIPIPMKKSSTEFSDTPRSSRGVKSKSNQEMRAKDHISKCQTPPKQSSGGPLVMALKNNNDNSQEAQAQAQTSQTLVCISNDDKIEEGYVNEKTKPEVFPPKMVAMHRATWNINKGSERLVCYGGAAGIVRCQEIR
ncbi:uncharacterized protein LOC143631685 isoform X2 [Bidens hawaiensis]|uniref:uncharacterized protein LOC143631685 isoform X2 n=1 Tax=Bidens hawaiensis TaxID=980011 RepID=UPI00404B5234